MSKSIGHETLICQCLKLLPTEHLRCPLLDYRKKLKTESLIKVFIAGQLDQWNSYNRMEEKLFAHPSLREELDLDMISGSQLSRRINDLPTETVEKLFYKVVEILLHLTRDQKGISKKVGLLKIVDSTELKLPKNLCEWATISKDHTAVKMHTRLVVTSPNTAFPDKIIPSTGNVSDFESAKYLIEDPYATYVTDRGYSSKMNLEEWLRRDISFVTRISKNLRVYIEKEFEPTHPSVTKDAIVYFGTSHHPVRYIEFTDEKDRVYRILTNRWDLEDTEILDIYKNRWIVELFFKWIKQHLKFTKIWSTKPQGIWNQMFLAVIAFGLSVIVKLMTRSTKTTWGFFQSLQTYLYKTYSDLLLELGRKKKESKGRQKVPIPSKPKPDFGTVAMVKGKRRI
ncbi:IS4 family transposase [Rossellomorea vietnamensis]|uniref:IS4 family transposase n=1 Tax=Rossellomorea vietnamensis TaxID=218284 RepID=A0A5D4MH79_9BACI|nr:IS4 family transposase [Rossellomorea vietnamensis]TYS01093.1 IS4 family transposase [Rossellomorea vietnamensis]